MAAGIITECVPMFIHWWREGNCTKLAKFVFDSELEKSRECRCVRRQNRGSALHNLPPFLGKGIIARTFENFFKPSGKNHKSVSSLL